jgi:hypothetical protein
MNRNRTATAVIRLSGWPTLLESTGAFAGPWPAYRRALSRKISWSHAGGEPRDVGQRWTGFCTASADSPSAVEGRCPPQFSFFSVPVAIWQARELQWQVGSLLLHFALGGHFLANCPIRYEWPRKWYG